MKLTFIFAAFLFVTSCEKKNNLKRENWIIFNDKNKLPTQIKDFFKSYEGEEFEIANPDENFNVSDVMQYQNAPFRQLRLLEKSNETWRIVYIQGGIGKSYKFYEFKIQGDTIANIKKGSLFENVETNDSLEYYIRKEKVNFEKVNIKYKWID